MKFLVLLILVFTLFLNVYAQDRNRVMGEYPGFQNEMRQVLEHKNRVDADWEKVQSVENNTCWLRMRNSSGVSFFRQDFQTAVPSQFLITIFNYLRVTFVFRGFKRIIKNISVYYYVTEVTNSVDERFIENFLSFPSAETIPLDDQIRPIEQAYIKSACFPITT